MNIKTFEKNCNGCKQVTEFVVLGFQTLKNGNIKYVGKCCICKRVNSVPEDKIKP